MTALTRNFTPGVKTWSRLPQLYSPLWSPTRRVAHRFEVTQAGRESDEFSPFTRGVRAVSFSEKGKERLVAESKHYGERGSKQSPFAVVMPPHAS